MSQLRIEHLRRRESSGRLLIALALALGVHVAMIPVFGALFDGARETHADKGGGTQLVRLAKESWQKNRRVDLEVRDARQQPPARKDEKKNDDDADAPGRVVTLPPPEREERPDVADYASEYDQKAERETRSRDQRQQMDVVARKLQQGQIGVPQPPTEAHQGRAALAAAGITPAGPEGPGRAKDGDSGSDPTDGQGQRAFAFELPTQAAQEPLKLKSDIDGAFRNRDAIAPLPGNGTEARIAMGPPTDSARKDGSGLGDETGQGRRGGGAGAQGTPSLDALTPSVSRLARIMGAPANDYLPDVEVDAETRLNAWRWKHATFFNRIADAIRREWQGGQVLTQSDPNGRVYGFEDRMTVLAVTLDRQGNVVSVAVAEESGAYVLDDEAVRAFKEAGPFSNPPPQLFKGDEKFTFQFGFNVTYNRTNFDLNWRP
jgi:TonB family protein